MVTMKNLYLNFSETDADTTPDLLFGVAVSVFKQLLYEKLLVVIPVLRML